jgi:hypothetical protein
MVASTGIALAATAAAPAAASAAECPVVPTTTAFAQFGDANQYFMAPGGSFDSLELWTRFGRVSLRDADSLLGLTEDTRAVDLDDKEAVASTSFCVDATMPHLRFAAKASGSGQLDVTVKLTFPDGSTDSSSGSVSPDEHRAWSPSRFVDLKASSIPAGQSASVTVTFRSQGDWLVDDVYIDPYRR